MVVRPFLHGCELPCAWANQHAWRILETGQSHGLNFLLTWDAWRADPQRPRSLHYVAIVASAPDPNWFETRARHQPDWAELAPLAQQLADQCFGLLPGFHRLEFEQGHVLLTLCIGALKPMLREQRFLADSVFLVSPDSPPGSPLDSLPASLPDSPGWDRWTTQSLARCCRRGTHLAASDMSPALQQALSQSGFEMRPAVPAAGRSELICSGIYNPRWEPKTSRNRSAIRAQLPDSCVVIGAGLAGASVAQALARRGWQVKVLDAASTPAAGASSLPVGLMVPHVSADDSPRSRLSRAGIRLMLNQARALLLDGQDWKLSGVLQRLRDAPPGASSDASSDAPSPVSTDASMGLPPLWSVQGLAWSQPCNNRLADTPWGDGPARPSPALWHGKAGWIKPQPLIKAWLAQPGVQFRGNSSVASIRRRGGDWVLSDAAGCELACAKVVVLAAATGSTELLNLLAGLEGLSDIPREVPALHAIPGQISWAMQRDADTAVLPAYPVNGLGHLIAQVPFTADAATGSQEGLAWFSGATFESQQVGGSVAAPLRADNHANNRANHRANHERLKVLLPACARALADVFDADQVQAWRNTRCATADRLPVLGPLMGGDAPTLWISTALGSRGLSLSVLCAELLAARLSGEPWPIEARLAGMIDSSRKNRL